MLWIETNITMECVRYSEVNPHFFLFPIEGMAERKSSQLPPSPPRQNREDLPTLVVAPRINIERNRAHLNLLDDGHRDLTDLRRAYGQLEERQLNQDK